MKISKKSIIKVLSKLFVANDVWQLLGTLLGFLNLQQKVFDFISQTEVFSVVIILLTLPSVIRKIKTFF